MSQFIKYNPPLNNTKQNFIKLVSPRKVCICCLAQDGTMVNLINCRHKRFLQDYFLMDYPMGLVCKNCHKMLEKIQTFKNQVEQCGKILKQQGLQRFTNKFKLIQSATTITTITDDINKMDSKVKHKLDFYLNDGPGTDLQSEFTSDIKIKTEQESDSENALPVTQITQRKKEQERVKVLEEVVSLGEKYNGKIQLIILSKEALIEERERESKREVYIKMPFKCEKCIKGFDHEVTLKGHMKKQHNKEGIYRCEVCDSVMSTEYSFKTHLKRHVNRYECMDCKMRTNDIYPLVLHFNQNHAELGFINQEFKCEDCEFATDSHPIYKYHRRTHGERRKCVKCDKMLATASALKTHMVKVHSDSYTRTRPKYNCSVCDKVYLSKTPLKHHMVNVHGDGTDGAFCDKCGKQYTSSYILQQHLKTHSAHVNEEDKKYVCHDCGAKFLTKPPLRTHIEWKHLKRNMYQCTICSKVLRSATTLKNHHRFVHEKRRPPKNKICDHCGKAFSSTRILRTHIRTHTGERPLVCVHCSATFAHDGALYTHIKLKHKSLNT